MEESKLTSSLPDDACSEDDDDEVDDGETSHLVAKEGRETWSTWERKKGEGRWKRGNERGIRRRTDPPTILE